MIRTTIAALALLLSLNAHAATAYLVRCDVGNSVTGTPALIGTYNYGGRTFTRAFPLSVGTCPMQIEVF